MILFDQLSIQPLLQVYTLKDRAPTYGGQNFSSTVDFVDLMLQSGSYSLAVTVWRSCCMVS